MRGGMDILISHFSKIGIWKKINTHLGNRSPRAEYRNDEVLQTWVINALSGSNRLEHSQSNRLSLLSHPKLNKGISPDTISRVFKSWATDNIYFSKGEGRHKNAPLDKDEYLRMPPEEKLKAHEVNINDKLNDLLIDTVINLGLLEIGKEYILDVDASIIETRVSDSRPHYKRTGVGYCPVFALLGGVPIYLEARNGNSNAVFRLKTVIKAAVELAESRGLKIKFVRSDAAGSVPVTIGYLIKNKINFIIRAHGAFTKNNDGHRPWKEYTGETSHIHSFANSQLKLNDEYVRLLWYNATFKSSRPGSKLDGRKKIFGILTSFEDLNESEIVKLYNQRGGMEQVFSYLNDLGMKYMPHRELKYNTVFMIVTLISYTFFLYAKKYLGTKLPFVKDNMEPRTFIKAFIEVITKWHGRGLRFYTRAEQFRIFSGVP